MMKDSTDIKRVTVCHSCRRRWLRSDGMVCVRVGIGLFDCVSVFLISRHSGFHIPICPISDHIALVPPKFKHLQIFHSSVCNADRISLTSSCTFSQSSSSRLPCKCTYFFNSVESIVLHSLFPRTDQDLLLLSTLFSTERISSSSWASIDYNLLAYRKDSISSVKNASHGPDASATATLEREKIHSTLQCAVLTTHCAVENISRRPRPEKFIMRIQLASTLNFI